MADIQVGPSDRPATTVEWGEQSERRERWWDRVLGRAEASGGAQPERGVGAGRGALTPASLGCAVVGFGLVIASQVLPWMDLTDESLSDTARQEIGGTTLSLDQLGTWGVFGYQLGWMLLLATLCVALAVDAGVRRVASAAAIGLAAGQLAVVVSLAHTVKDGGGVFRIQNVNGSGIALGEGVYCAYGAVLLFGLAILLAGRRPGRRSVDSRRPGRSRRVTADVKPTAEPPDLTVTPIRTREVDGYGRVSR